MQLRPYVLEIYTHELILTRSKRLENKTYVVFIDPLHKPRAQTDLRGKGEVGILKVGRLSVGAKMVLCVEEGERRLAVGVSEARVHCSS